MIPLPDEAEFKVQIKNLYKDGGLIAVLNCLQTMTEVQVLLVKTIKNVIIEEAMKQNEDKREFNN